MLRECSARHPCFFSLISLHFSHSYAHHSHTHTLMDVQNFSDGHFNTPIILYLSFSLPNFSRFGWTLLALVPVVYPVRRILALALGFRVCVNPPPPFSSSHSTLLPIVIPRVGLFMQAIDESPGRKLLLLPMVIASMGWLLLLVWLHLGVDPSWTQGAGAQRFLSLFTFFPFHRMEVAHLQRILFAQVSFIRPLHFPTTTWNGNVSDTIVSFS